MPYNHSGVYPSTSPELLAPAGSPEALKAAIAAGADAIYLAGRRFGARHYAANFSDDELQAAIDYAHLHGVRIYVTVNTLVSDAELTDVTRYLLWLYEIGVDAVLVQDIGVATIAQEIVPDLPLHASTQMTIHNREGVAQAERKGFSRVVLARELTLAEIEDIIETSEIGIEVFAHGALCYCYSGQCLLSSVIGGRSGNRGMCAQPCRKPYRLVTAEMDEHCRPGDLQVVPTEGDYLLSTRDLAVYPDLDRLARTPVACLKIEGRMRSAEYVATVVSIYRHALDAIAAGDAWSPSEKDMQDLELAFNRKFTVGYTLGATDIMARDRPGNRGVPIGTVTGYNPRRQEATVRLNNEIMPRSGDGLVFCTDEPERDVGTLIYGNPVPHHGSIRVRVAKPVGRGARAFLTKSAELEERARKIVENLRPIPIDLKVTWHDGTPYFEGELPGPEEEKIRVSYQADLKMEPARNRPLFSKKIAEHFTRTGGTPFTIRRLDLSYPGGLFAPSGALNQARREFLREVEEAVAASWRPNQDEVHAARKRTESVTMGFIRQDRDTEQLPTISIYTNTVEEIRAATRAGVRTIYFEPPGPVSHAILEEIADLCLAEGAEPVWKWPPITRRSFLDAATPHLQSAHGAGICGVMVSGLGAADAVRKIEPRMKLFGAVGLNIWNHRTLMDLTPLFLRCTVSPELPAADLSRLAGSAGQGAPHLEVLAQGNVEALVTEDRLAASASCDRFLGLQDRRGRVFPIWCDDESRTYIANAVETCLIDYLPQIIEMGIDAIAIDARGRGPRYAEEMTRFYLDGIEAADRGDAGTLSKLKEEVKKRALGGITGGHFTRRLAE